MGKCKYCGSLSTGVYCSKLCKKDSYAFRLDNQRKARKDFRYTIQAKDYK